ncbi:MAG: 50S ribosomal protein L15 [Candidatus Magasanikbacteria bacterium]
MSLTANTISSNPKAKKANVKRVGRGNGSGKGSYSARGMKGQRSRSGGKSGLKIKGFRQSLLKIPKLRGFHSMYDKKQTVTLATLNRICEVGDVVTPFFLEKKGAIARADAGVKIVSKGKIMKNIEVQGCLLSKVALDAIEKAGGKVTF